MILEYIRYRIPAEDQAAFLAAYTASVPHLVSAPQCLSYELSQCDEETDRFIMRIEWTSLNDHLQGFRHGPHFPPFLTAIRPFIPCIEEMQHYHRTPVCSS